PMPISCVCPSCAVKLGAPDDRAGQRTKCPKCGTAIVVPNPVNEAVQVAIAQPLPSPVEDVLPTSASPDPRPPSTAPTSVKEKVTLIEQTSKRYKLIQLIGFLVAIAAFPIVYLLAGPNGPSDFVLCVGPIYLQRDFSAAW